MDEGRQTYDLFCNLQHSPNSHDGYHGKFLALHQVVGVATAVQADSGTTGTKVIGNSKNYPDERMHVDSRLAPCVKCLVKKKRDAILADGIDGMDM